MSSLGSMALGCGESAHAAQEKLQVADDTSVSAEPDRETPLRQPAAIPLRKPGVLNPNADREAVALQDSAEMAELKRDLESVHSQLDQLNSAIIAVQTHSLRQTGGVALTLSVLMVIAWKVIGG
jgi:hypothetical protein